MLTFGAFSFIAPFALLGLVALPALWWLLRVIPPAPRRVRFPAIKLIMTLVNPEQSAAKSPLWLTLLRLALVTLVILGAAHPMLNADNRLDGEGTLVLIVDDGWTAAKNWAQRQATFSNLLDQAERGNRSVAVVTTAPRGSGDKRPQQSVMAPAAAREVLLAMTPKPWATDRQAALSVIKEIGLQGDPQIIWLSDGADHGTAAAFAAALQKVGTVTVLADAPAGLPRLLLPPTSDRNGLTLRARRADPASGRTMMVRVRGGDDGAVLTRKAMIFESGQTAARLTLELPVEIRNKVTHMEIENENSAGATALVDERWRRRPVGLVNSADPKGDRPLLDDYFYLARALDPFTEVRTGDIPELLKRKLAMLVLADPGIISGGQRARLVQWMQNGGIVLRFAGPRLASDRDPLLPVKLRKDDRELGGALSWTTPAQLAAFDENSPFAGLAVPKDVRIRRQVLAQPSIGLSKKTWARLTDGTPLVTSQKFGAGWLVFVHTSANPTWSNLPLSGLFVEMLQNLVRLSRGVTGKTDDRLLEPVQSLNGFGLLGAPGDGALGIKADAATKIRPGPQHPPGFYGDDTAGLAINLASSVTTYKPLGSFGAGVETGGYQEARETDLRSWLLSAALVLLLADIVASLALRGFLGVARIAALVFAVVMAGPAFAQTEVQGDIFKTRRDIRDFAPTLNVRIAYVKTGIRAVDNTSRTGLSGLAFIANSRTAAEMGEPVAIDPGTQELAYFPLIYWPVTENTPVIRPDTAAKLNAYMKSGGTIFFDTRDQGGANFGTERLEEIARHLNVPMLRAVPSDHVLTRTYYLLREFPGRWAGGRLWVAREGSRVNDGVSSVIVGGHDWASAWALDDERKPLYPVVPGGERQREMAFRFGINLIMYVLTGNYKADQVHVPAIMERLGQ